MLGVITLKRLRTDPYTISTRWTIQVQSSIVYSPIHTVTSELTRQYFFEPYLLTNKFINYFNPVIIGQTTIYMNIKNHVSKLGFLGGERILVLDADDGSLSITTLPALPIDDDQDNEISLRNLTYVHRITFLRL